MTDVQAPPADNTYIRTGAHLLGNRNFVLSGHCMCNLFQNNNVRFLGVVRQVDFSPSVLVLSYCLNQSVLQRLCQILGAGQYLIWYAL